MRKDKAVVWGEANINLIRNNQGQPLYFLPIIIDITERKKTEDALCGRAKISTARYSRVPATSMILIEEDMTISMSNEEFARNTGFSADEHIIGQSEYRFSPEVQR